MYFVKFSKIETVNRNNKAIIHNNMGSCQTEVCCFTPHKEIELFAEWPYGDSH